MRIAPFAAVLLSLTVVATGGEKLLLLTESPALIVAPDLKGPLPEAFSISKGKWTPENGEITVVNLPEEKHIPVLHHLVGLESAVIEVEFQVNGAGSFLVGCDSTKHIGRVVINATGMSIAEDSVKPSHTIATLNVEMNPGTWHKLRVEWTGESMAASLDGKELSARHPFLATAKNRSWLAASDGVKIRNLRISGDQTVAP